MNEINTIVKSRINKYNDICNAKYNFIYDTPCVSLCACVHTCVGM